MPTRNGVRICPEVVGFTRCFQYGTYAGVGPGAGFGVGNVGVLFQVVAALDKIDRI